MLTVSAALLDVVPLSRVGGAGVEWMLARTAAGLRLVALAGHEGMTVLSELEGDIAAQGDRTLCVGPLSPRNAAVLRRHLPWLTPRALGLQTSAGLGDRLGLATPGHVRALRVAGRGIAPVLAQQSIREMTRTGRTPRQVVDAATWGAFEEGWREGYGADADHLKTTADIDACLAAGFTFFTIDPGEHVESAADTATDEELRESLARLPWDVLEDTASSLLSRCGDRTFDVDGHHIRLDTPALVKAAVKYGRAVAHVSQLFRHLDAAAPAGGFDLEVSVDETETPTSHAEHVYVASELRRLGVRWVSLAPRFIGRFEKGVDYIGDIAAFEADLSVHAAIARALGPYKLSLHSGSDKFSIYPAAARQTRGLVHLKTAGTSYLEALRTLAVVEPALLREIYVFARDRYGADRASYHVSAEVSRAPAPEAFANGELSMLLEDFDAREILHVTFGSVLTSCDREGRALFADRLVTALGAHRDVYADCLEAHFVRHLRPFAAESPS
jgi:hypothetical protein